MSDVDTLADRMKRLLSTGVDADVHALFEENEPIEIPDVDIDVFKTMLNFIYTDDLSGVNGDNAIDVLYAAKKYNLPTLVKACVGIPIAKLDNVFIAFDEARLLDEKAFLEIDDQELLCEVLGRDQLVVSEEIAIWNAALRWADEQCAQNGKECSGENRREMLGTALYKIRFPIIHKDCLANIVSSGVLTSAELVSVLLYHSSAALSEPYPLRFPIRQRTTVYIDGLQWNIFAQIETKSGNKYLGFFIKCNAYDYGSNWSCSCSATLRIVSTNEETADLVRKIEHKFSAKTTGWSLGYGYEQFTSYEALMSPYNGWYNVEEDTVTLSADLTVYELSIL
ncbi:hypothetical protein niasHS_008322 [Heterodera schachtii]|uniref:BTB domain-containing protein n=1 Tax=Heterodera schachtii TaxID=97005 RepID=A0ABD2JA73_HETSC